MVIINITIIWLSLCFGHSFAAHDEKGFYIRKSVTDLSVDEWESLKKGFEVLKSRDNNTDDCKKAPPTAYCYQANIHGWSGYTEDNTLVDAKHWHQCKHGHNWFLPWHRMYLYNFERILRNAAGDKYLTIPYWDYFNNSRIPDSFIFPSNASNPLYDPDRCHQINAGGKIPDSIVSHMRAFSFGDFTPENENSSGFGGGKLTQITDRRRQFEDNKSGSLEVMPHNQIHLYLGGKMADNCKASQDPIFWFHHAQIDRLWESWSSHDGGRKYPTDMNWLNQDFTFFDETGTATPMKIKDVLDPKQLRYKYDRLESLEKQKTRRPCTNCTLIAELKEPVTHGVMNPGHDSVVLTLTPEALVLLNNISESLLEDATFTLVLEIKSINNNLSFDVHLSDSKDDFSVSLNTYVRPLAVLGCTAIKNTDQPTVQRWDVTDIYKNILKLNLINDHKVRVSFKAVDCNNEKSEIWLNLSGVKLLYGNEKKQNGQEKCHFPVWGWILICTLMLRS